jgi:hypothetical protein
MIDATPEQNDNVVLDESLTRLGPPTGAGEL